jgi:multisubunit Na+/H+ antiporter MnhB subunit
VSAILTDFRGTDTLIEITVFSIAAIGIVSLLLRGRDDSYDLAPNPENVKYSILMQESEIETESSLNTPFTRVVTIVALPFAILIALSHILYGADAPGDGFTGGVVGGLGISLWYIVFGYRETRQRLGRIASSWFMRIGLALAFLNAVVPILWGDAFLSYNELDIKAPAGLHFASTLLFEIGIALAIFGSVAMIMASIAHPRNIEPAERLQHNPDIQQKNEE